MSATKQICALVFCALAAACSGSEEVRVEEVDRLIAQSNALGAFDAAYQVTTADGAQSVLRLVYQAPEKLKLEIISQPSADVIVKSETRILDGVLTVAASEGTSTSGHANVDCNALVERDKKADALLAELFPGASAIAPPPPGAAFTLQWGMKSAAGKPYVSFGAAYLPVRPALLGWLDALRELPCREGAANTLEFKLADTFTIELSKETGFIDRLTGETEGRTTTFVLSKLDLSGAIDPREFEVPPVAPESVDITSQVIKPISESMLMVHRDSLLGRLDASVLAGSTQWDAAAQQKLVRVLELAHTDTLPAAFGPWTADSRARAEQLLAHVREELAKEGADRAKIEEEIAGFRTQLVSTLGFLRNSYLEQLQLPRDYGADTARWEQYLTAEREAVARAFETQVAQPMLGYFDEQMKDALGG